MAAVNTSNFGMDLNAIPGLIADNTALYGIPAAIANLGAIVTSDVAAVMLGSNTTQTLTSGQFTSFVWDISGSPGGGVTLTTPTATQIIAALPSTIPQNGRFGFETLAINDGCGQTITVAAGSNVTLLGTMTLATNTSRRLFVNVNVAAGTVTVMNLGAASL